MMNSMANSIFLLITLAIVNVTYAKVDMIPKVVTQVKDKGDPWTYDTFNGLEITADEKDEWYRQAVEDELKITKADDDGHKYDAMASYTVVEKDGNTPTRNLLKCYSKFGVQFWLYKTDTNKATILHYE